MTQVVIYTTPTCPWCSKVKAYLAEKGVDYEEIDVSQDAEAARTMMELTGQRSVPVTVIGGQPIVGFNRTELEKRLH